MSFDFDTFDQFNVLLLYNNTIYFNRIDPKVLNCCVHGLKYTTYMLYAKVRLYTKLF